MEIQLDINKNIIRKYRPSFSEEDRLIIYNPENGPNYGLYTFNNYPNCSKIQQNYLPSNGFNNERSNNIPTGHLQYYKYGKY